MLTYNVPGWRSEVWVGIEACVGEPYTVTWYVCVHRRQKGVPGTTLVDPTVLVLPLAALLTTTVAPPLLRHYETHEASHIVNGVHPH